MKALILAAGLVLPSGFLQSQSPKPPRRSEIYSRKTVRPIINALELDNSDAKNDALAKAGLHAWDVWRDVNEIYTVNAKQVNNRQLTEVPRWFTWCTTDDLAKIKSNKNPSVCTGLGKKEEELTEASPPRKDLFKGFRGRSKAQPPDTKADVYDVVLESTHFNAAAVRGLLKLMRDFCGIEVPLSSFDDCVQRPPLKKMLPKDLLTLSPDAQWNLLIQRSLSEAAVVVKASWLLVEPQPNSGYHFFNFPGPWMGVESLRDATGHVSFSGSPPTKFSIPTHYSGTKVVLPERGKKCPEKNDRTTIDRKVDEHSINDFFYFQYCGDLKTFGQGQGRVQVINGNYLILRALHVMTNTNPSGDWAWSTYYWHNHGEEFDKLAPIAKDSRRDILLQVRPKNLKGWQGNYHMDLIYTHKGKIDADPEVVAAVNQSVVQNDPSDQPTDAKSYCNFDPHDKIPAGVFNPYIEARFKCGAFSNCIGCHSHATVGNSIGPTFPPEHQRVRRQDDPNKPQIATHFLWSLARSFQAPKQQAQPQ
jgi:hypothetical protein